jgi:DNA-directed RNA polymerase subunit beta'
MAVHVPLSNSAILEAQLLMLASHNILNPQNGTPITLPSQDMVLGLYYITKGRKSTPAEKVRGEAKAFYSEEEVIIAFNEGKVDLHAWIKVKANIRNADGLLEHKLIDTTVGRVLFNQHVPREVGFVNALLTKKNLREIIGDIIRITNVPKTAKFLDDIKQLGFRTAFQGGLSFNINDLIIPDIKEELLENAKTEVDEVWESYNMGLITNNERYNQIVDIWSRVDTRITETLIRELSNDKQGFNSVYMMLDSGARGSKQQIKQLAGIRGLMANGPENR